MRSRAVLVPFGALVAALAAWAAFVLLRPAAEAQARARLEREARRLGLSATVGSVHLTPWLALELRDLVLEDAGHVRVMTRAVKVRPRLSLRGALGRAADVSLARTVVELPAGARLEIEPSTWAVESAPPELRLRRLQAGERLEIELRRGRESLDLEAHAAGARLSGLVRLLVHGCPVADAGTLDGDGRVQRDAAGGVRLALRARARSLAVAALTTAGDQGCDGTMGAPTDAEIEADAVLQPARGSLRADRLRLVAGGIDARGRLAVDGGVADPRIDLELGVERADFARLLATAGLDLPADDLGRASLDLRVTGPLLDPAALRVTQRLDFTPPSRPLPSIERLKGPFVHRAVSAGGVTTLIHVDPDSPDFIGLADVPPLFVRTLLLGEDAGFYGHHGIDLTELPAALATDLARGTFARGASTIPQQLAKNLFLSREKTVSRKLEELALALLLDARVGKDRLLEIYLNVIEWGPGLYGLRPAARHYFGKEPGALTPKQMAFLVSLIPGPLKYQRSFAGGNPTPFLEGLMATLLAKLNATGALGDEEYRLALAEPLDLRV